MNIKASEWRTRIPPALCRTTDQSNVDRLADGFIGTPLFATDREGFFAYRDGRWESAEQLVYRRAARLPELIAAEAPDSDYSADALSKWARRSEAYGVQQRAVEMLRRLCMVRTLDHVVCA